VLGSGWCQIYVSGEEALLQCKTIWPDYRNDLLKISYQP
jgi:hypothetical protein